MGNNRFLVYVGKLWGLPLTFCFYLSFICYVLFVCWSCKGIKNREERDRDTFKLNFYFGGLWQFCEVKCFPEPIEITVLLSQGFRRNLRNHFGKLWIVTMKYKGFESPPCVCVVSWYVQLMLLWAGDTTHCSARGLSIHMCSNWLLREKGPSDGKGFSDGFLFWHQEAHLFRNVWIVLPIRGPLGDCHFCIYLFHFLFIVFLFLFFHAIVFF